MEPKKDSMTELEATFRLFSHQFRLRAVLLLMKEPYLMPSDLQKIIQRPDGPYVQASVGMLTSELVTSGMARKQDTVIRRGRSFVLVLNIIQPPVSEILQTLLSQEFAQADRQRLLLLRKRGELVTDELMRQ